ncbi:MAG: hypothetical protein WD708_11855 [Kiritimatiellia bacterium]
MNYIPLLSFCFLFALTPLAAQQPDMEDLNTEAYLSMLDADKLLEEKKQAEALPLYQQALQAYQQLKSRDPEFKTRIVDYRIEVLTEKIDTLRNSLPAQEKVQPAPKEASNVPLEDNYETLYVETREKMLRDAARLLELEKRNIEMVVTLRENQQTLHQQQSQLQELRKELSDRESAQQKSTNALRKEIEDLNRFNTLLQERTDRLESSTRDLTTERDELRGTIQERNRQLSELDDIHQKTQKELAAEKLNATQSEQRMILARNQLRDDLDATKRELESARQAEALAAEKMAEVALLEETVIELNNRNEQQSVQLREATERIDELEQIRKELEQSRKDREEAIEKLAEITEEVKSTREVTRNLRRAESELEDAEKEVAKLRLNFQQEQDARTRLQATVEQQLKTTTERMNEILNLRREITELKKQAPGAATEADESPSEAEAE